ncbi:MAG: alpha/beta fold hydrolase [Pseudomonadota bacterium]
MAEASAIKVNFSSSEGHELAAALERPDGEPRGYALFAHCFTCSKDIKAAREIARGLCAEGFAVLRFDFTGLGGSEGDFANTNFSSNVADLVAAADYLRREHQPPAIVIGHSLGGAAALVASGRIPEVRGVVTVNAPADADHVALQIGAQKQEIEKSGKAEVTLAGRPFTIKAQFLKDLEAQNVLGAVETLRKPLLVMHTPVDQTVGIENATKIFVAAKHPKSFVSLDGADHLLSRAKDARYAAGVLAAWAARYLDGAASPASGAGVVAPEPVPGGARAVAVAAETFAASVSAGGRNFIIDADVEDGGGGLGPNPTRVLESALAACAVITMRMYAKRKGWPVEDIDVAVKRAANEDSHAPHVLEKEVRLSGDLTAEQRARMLEIADKCPVHRILSDRVEIRSALA